jgi:hypothetical protein
MVKLRERKKQLRKEADAKREKRAKQEMDDVRRRRQ